MPSALLPLGVLLTESLVPGHFADSTLLKVHFSVQAQSEQGESHSVL